MHIDETFIASIVMDIVRGMIYIHKTSHLGVHGNLKSSNCLVTGRWVVKLSDFGLTNLRTKYRDDRGNILVLFTMFIIHVQLTNDKMVVLKI